MTEPDTESSVNRARAKRLLCHGARSISVERLFSVFQRNENSTFTCHFSFSKRVRKQHQAQRETMPTFSTAASGSPYAAWKRAEVCVCLNDYTSRAEDILCKRDAILGAGNFNSKYAFSCLQVHVA